MRGIGAGADAFRVAHMLPNLFRRLVGEGAVTSAFVPVYARHCSPIASWSKFISEAYWDAELKK